MDSTNAFYQAEQTDLGKLVYKKYYLIKMYLQTFYFGTYITRRRLYNY